MNRSAVANLLEEHGILPTAQRVDIAAVMLSRRQHLSAEQVLVEARARGACVSKATVYNTLGLFAQKGLIREVIVDPAKVFYDSNNAPHFHFYNTDTGVLSDIDPEGIRVENLPRLPSGTTVERVDVIVRVREKHRG
jgi:Fur family iron response transcriptional regulator